MAAIDQQFQQYPGAEGNGYDSYGQEAPAPAAEPADAGQFIQTLNQANGGGPMRQGRGGSRFNPMGRKPLGDGGPVSAANAEKNDQGYIIFAYNIGYQTDDSALYSLFAQFGTVAKVNIMQDFQRQQGKGYGFVTMPNQSEAEASVRALNGTNYNGNTLQIRFKSPKGTAPQIPLVPRGRGGMRGGRGAPRGGRGAFGASYSAGRGGGFRGGRGRGAPRGGGGRGRGAYSSAPSAYDQGYGYGGGYDAGYGGGYDSGAYDYSSGGAYDYQSYTGSGYGSYGGAGGHSW